MAACIWRRILLKPKFYLLTKHYSNGYIVLLPETPQDLPDENPLLRNESLPEFSNLTTENCEAAMAKHTQTFEAGLWKIEEKLQKHKDINVLEEVMEPLETLSVPMENAWGLVKTLYLTNQSLMPGKRYMNIHERARRVRSNKFNSLPIYEACKEGLKKMNLNEEERRLLNKFVLEGRLNGLEVDGGEKLKLIDILTVMNQKRASFKNKLNAATNAFKHTVTDAAAVRDFPPRLLAAVAEEPDQPSRGPWHLTLQPEILQPVLKYCSDRDIRENLWLARVRRCAKDVNQTLATSVDLEEIRDRRQAQAKALGFPTYLHMSMETKMAETVENVQNMLLHLLERARVAQEHEVQALEEFAQARGFEGSLQLWDIPFWKRKMQKALYQFDDERLREFFPLSQVLLGLFTLCEQLFDIKIEEREGANTWHPQATFYRILDGKSREVLGGFYLDPFARQGKVLLHQDPGWMVGLRSRSAIANSQPLAALIFNFQEPLFGKPALLSFQEVQLLFRRFGHTLQHVLTQTRYSEVSGLSNVEWDAVEICSRFLELWVWDRGTLESVSGHYETGELLPSELLENLHKVQQHMAGFELCQEIYLSNLDMELHRTSEFWLQVVQRLWPSHFLFDLHRDDNHPCSFSEIFCEEWGAAYYCHLWAKVVAADVYSAFIEAGRGAQPEVAAVGARFRSTYLSLGGSSNPGEVFKQFRGRGPSSESLIRMLGLNSSTSHEAPSTEPALVT